MSRFSEYAFAVPMLVNRLSAAIVFLAVSISLVPAEVRSETTTCHELVGDMAAQQKMIGTFRTLDYQIREHFLIVANAILSTYGGWNTKEGWSSNAAQLGDSAGEYEKDALVIRRDIDRAKAISEEELQRLNGVIDSFVGLIKTGDQIANEISDGRVNDANQVYFETARPSYLHAHGELYTLITTAQRRVASMARTPCS